MPTYEYRCEKGHNFERIQKMSDKPLTKCPVCGARSSRIISGGQGVIFKGSGFYITDYGKDGKGARKDPDGSAAPSATSDAKGEKKGSDTTAKPDAKADVKPAATTPKSGKSDE
jgi:putative FmdB family regulatory protein